MEDTGKNLTYKESNTFMTRPIPYILIVALLVLCDQSIAQRHLRTDVLVVGGGTGGSAAGIQAARSGARTVIAEQTTWLGGMLSAAGVSAFDGNHNMPSGIWSQFRNELYKVYGGPSKVATGWVSNTLFEPHVADSILKRLASAEQKLTVRYGLRFTAAIMKGNRMKGARFRDEATGRKLTIRARQVIDATELGDVIADAGIPSDIGMEASTITGEKVNVPATNDIIQDMTFAAILKDFGPGVDRTLVRPAGYDPMEFDGCCNEFCSKPDKLTTNVNARQMIDYGRLPNDKYMINWPGKGNDIYLNMIGMSPAERELAVTLAKAKTLRFIYFLQTQTGFRNLGLADDEFPTADKLPLIPYHRESRRVRGIIRFNLNHIAEPYSQPEALYRTGIAVGDYPVDHHHRENLNAPQHLGFYPVPSFNLPLGALIPAGYDGIIAAEKNISVSNVANGTTRLQPCVMLTGQAAGLLAALSVASGVQPAKVPVRKVQAALLEAGAYIMPYFDVKPDHPHFAAIQRIGATGILKGRGEPYQWANRTWFYPDSLVRITEIMKDARDFTDVSLKGQDWLSVGGAIELASGIASARIAKAKDGTITDPATLAQKAGAGWAAWGLQDFNTGRPITRCELAVLLDKTVDPFNLIQTDLKGFYIKSIK